MMMIGELRRPHHHPTVEIPDWDPYDAVPSPITFSPSADYSPSSAAADYAAALHQRYDHLLLPADSDDTDSSDVGLQHYDSFACDDFRMYDFKVRRCVRGRSHDWTECPFAHPGEKARRRDPRRFHYSGAACPDFRKGCCRKGDACDLAHGVFECWLHPSRYRTQPCKDGVHCTRRVCFFAHSADQLRVLPADNDSSSPYESPPASPSYAVAGGGGGGPRFDSVAELVGAIKGLHVATVAGGGGGGGGSPARCWGYQQRSGGGGGFGSPRTGFGLGNITPNRSGLLFDTWSSRPFEEEPVAEKPVESGRDIRAMMYARLRKNNSLDRADSTCPVPDLGWVSELVK